jgi:hypothetical protein
VPGELSTRYLLTTCGDVCGLELRDFFISSADLDAPKSLFLTNASRFAELQ